MVSFFSHCPIFNYQILSYENKLWFTYGDKNKSRYSGETKSCISNAAWNKACGWCVQIAGINAHTQTAPGQKLPLCFALSTPLIYSGKKSCDYSPERNPSK